jgi:hypothetical protein
MNQIPVQRTISETFGQVLRTEVEDVTRIYLRRTMWRKKFQARGTNVQKPIS